MTVASAVEGVVQEGTDYLRAIRAALVNLDLTTTSLVAIRDKYDRITREVLARGYDAVVEARSLPPVNPSLLFDQERLGLTDITALGDIFFPSNATGTNLSDLKSMYLSIDKDLTLAASLLDANPPGQSERDTFDMAINRFIVKTTSARNPGGTIKTREQVAEDLGTDTFELFNFPLVSQLYFIVMPEYIGLNKQLTSTARDLGVPKDQLTPSVIWYGSVNPTSSNFSKMKVTYQLSNLQIRSASFGDDLAITSSSVFTQLLQRMQAQFNFVTSSLPSTDDLNKILDAVQQDALSFLAQITFNTTVMSDRDVINDARDAGVTDASLEDALEEREDPAFRGANLNANDLRTVVFPETSNFEERRALGFALQQETDSLRFTNIALNVPTDYRAAVVLASKRLVASIDAHRIIITRENATQQDIQAALLGVLTDIAALQTAYDTFLAPPEPGPRARGSRTTESTNNMLTRACNLVRSLRIRDQITQFPNDFDGGITPDLQEVLDGMLRLSTLIDRYLTIYRSGELRDFLAGCVSVASMTNLLLADGQPQTSLLVSELPAGIEQLRDSIQTVLIGDSNTEVLYNDVSLQVGALTAVLRGSKEEDPVGRLLALPVTVLDALLPSDEFPDAYSIPLENGQEEALRQLRDSFDILQRTVPATIRDLGVYRDNFGCALNDANFFVARLAGDSVNDLVTELRQS